MADASAVLTAFRDFLVAQGLVRKPGVTGALPPLHVEPRGGAPAPGQRDAPEDNATLVVTARLSGEVTQGPMDTTTRVVVIDVIYRSLGTAGLKAGRALDASIRNRVVERNDYGVGFAMGGLSVIQARIAGGLGPVSEDGDVRTERAAYYIEVLA